MKLKVKLLTLVLAMCAIVTCYAQHPYVYDVENTGSTCAEPPLPDPDQLTNYPMLPDPFGWSDGSGRSTDFADWECRRNEIKAEIEEYEIGPKPDRPSDITANYEDGVLTVNITENGETLTLTSEVNIPDGDGPFPVVIGMNNPTGSLPANLFSDVIQIPFMHNQVVTYTQTSERDLDDPYYKLYPDLTYVGNYSAWSWGVSRLIDGIEIVQDQLQADMQHLAVTGCSYAGKMALFSGAFDERIALTIVQESGGGGINSWRVSETIGNVEKIDNTNYSWFMQSMKTNFQGRVGTLPHDHHELMAMIVPRALLVLGNPPYEWLGDESGYVASRAVQEVYKTFDIEDRFGFSFRSGHTHCSLPSESNSEVRAFVDKFLFDDTTADTNIEVHPFQDVDYNKWIEAWKEPADPNAPVVSLDEPANNSTYESPATITFTASVTDMDDNVTKVEFYNDDEKIGEDTTAPYSFTWNDVEAGTYFISAEAIDAEDLRGFSNVVSVIVRAPSVEVFKTEVVPTIDGTVDAIWNNPKVVSFVANHELVGTDIAANDLSGSAKMIWDDDNVYLLAEVTDEAYQNDSANIYEDDNVEFYFDSNNSKSSPYDENDVQYSFAWNDGTTIGTIPSNAPTEGINYTIVETDAGYIVEAQIPWENLQGTPEDGKEIGFEFMINDDDDGGGRDGKLSWNATEDQAWQDASLFGTIILNSSETLATADVELGSKIAIYPNPSQNILRIQGIEQEFNYQIFDITGKVQRAGKADRTIQIENLATGVYFLNIITGSTNTSIKFIKK